jgi:hypothetical protein
MDAGDVYAVAITILLCVLCLVVGLVLTVCRELVEEMGAIQRDRQADLGWEGRKLTALHAHRQERIKERATK